MAKAAKWLIGAWLLLWPVCALAATQNVSPQDEPPRAAPTGRVDVYSLPPPGIAHFSARAITDAYLNKIPPEAKAKSDAYVNGGYIIAAAQFIWLLLVSWVLLRFRIFVRFRHWGERYITSWLRIPTIAAGYIVTLSVLTFPFDYYQGFMREHSYGLSHMSFETWGHDWLTSFAISLVLLSILISVLYAVIRGAKKRWWLWGAGITVIFMTVIMILMPTILAPMFNDYSSLPDSAMKSAILSQARANGVPAHDVFVFDASKQSNRISANVSGLLGTTRISLNDNLLDRCTPSEVLAVTGHEIGHYVMDHTAIMLTWFGLIAVVVFWLAHILFRRLSAKHRAHWQITGLSDPAGLPLFGVLFLVLTTLATPVTNTISRNMEHQADIFGLNAVRQPDAFAKVVLKLSNYRKLDPGPVEEFLLFDHPSGRNRILTAMRWKAAHRYDPDILAGPLSPAVPYHGPESIKATRE